MERIGQAASSDAAVPQEPSVGRKARVVSLRRWSVAASVAVLVGVGATLFFQQRSSEGIADSVAQQMVASADDDYIDEAADYLMADNNAIYTYLAYE